MEETFSGAAETVLALVNRFPGLGEGERFHFTDPGAEHGLALRIDGGPVILEERRSVTGRIRRLCRLPFTAVCRTGGAGQRQRLDTAAWLETLGRWLEGQTVTVGGRDHCLAAYPAPAGAEPFSAIRRAGSPRQAEQRADRTETWIMELTADYPVRIEAGSKTEADTTIIWRDQA